MKTDSCFLKSRRSDYRYSEGLLRLPLIGHSFHLRLQGFLVTEVIMPNSIEVIVKFIHKRDAGRDVHADNVTVGDIVEVFYEGA